MLAHETALRFSTAVDILVQDCSHLQSRGPLFAAAESDCSEVAEHTHSLAGSIIIAAVVSSTGLLVKAMNMRGIRPADGGRGLSSITSGS